MVETIAVEAIRGMSAGAALPTEQVTQVADPEAVTRFQDAMQTDQVPFADRLGEAWHAAQDNYQGILHRIRALSALRGTHPPSAAEMSELQYEVANLAFQQEVVAKVADKTSNAIQTLIKNQ